MSKKQLPKYRSKLEARVALGLSEWEYESEKMGYIIHKTYNPDFIKGNIFIEVKGFFRSGDTQKYKAIHDQMLKENKIRKPLISGVRQPMAKTVEELIEDITRDYDVDLLVEILCISAEELLERFDDKLMIAIERGDFEDGT